MPASRSITPPATAGPDGAVCEITEMPQNWCAHCRNALRFHRKLRDKMHAPPTGIAVSVRFTFIAQHSLVCHHCGADINPGEKAGITTGDDHACHRCLR